MRWDPPHVRENRAKEVAKLYKSGLGSTTIARKIGMSCTMVLLYLKEQGVTEYRHDHRKKMTPQVLKRIIEDYDNGMNFRQLWSKYDIAHTTIRYHFRKIGKKVRPNVYHGKENRCFRGGDFDLKIAARATMAVQHALKKGTLTRPDRCEGCHKVIPLNKSGKPGIHGHHSDYNKYLDVIWFCRKCHYEWHKVNKAIPRSLPEGT